MHKLAVLLINTHNKNIQIQFCDNKKINTVIKVNTTVK